MIWPTRDGRYHAYLDGVYVGGAATLEAATRLARDSPGVAPEMNPGWVRSKAFFEAIAKKHGGEPIRIVPSGEAFGVTRGGRSTIEWTMTLRFPSVKARWAFERDLHAAGTGAMTSSEHEHYAVVRIFGGPSGNFTAQNPLRQKGAEWFEDLPPNVQAGFKALRKREMGAWKRQQFPLKARHGAPDGEELTILGPVNLFPPYDDPAYGFKGPDYTQLLAERASGERWVVMASGLFYPDGRPVLTPWPTPRRPLTFMGHAGVPLFDPKGASSAHPKDNPAASDAQRRLFGAALALKRGETKVTSVSPAARRIAASMTETAIAEFARKL